MFCRYLLNDALPWPEEVARALMIWMMGLEFFQRGFRTRAASFHLARAWIYLAMPVFFGTMLLVNIELVLREVGGFFGRKEDFTLNNPSPNNAEQSVKAQCSICHSGPLQTDHQFHSLALPQFGPGRTGRFDLKARDMGRINESDKIEDAYHFRTPSLRNVQHTAPHGHNGAYKTLEAIIGHHADPIAGLASWSHDQLELPNLKEFNDRDCLITADKQKQERLKLSASIKPVAISNVEIQALVEFLSALNDKQSLYGRLGIPDAVPSHLSIDP